MLRVAEDVLRKLRDAVRRKIQLGEICEPVKGIGRDRIQIVVAYV